MQETLSQNSAAVDTAMGSSAPASPKPERCEIHPSSINEKQFAKLRQKRQVAKRAGVLIYDATLYATQLCNAFFKFVSGNTDLDAQAVELERLNRLWKQWLRSRTDKYKFAECAPFFLQKINFMVGDKTFNEQQLEKIKNAGENLES